jgi:hypothetical protein
LRPRAALSIAAFASSRAYVAASAAALAEPCPERPVSIITVHWRRVGDSGTDHAQPSR